MARTTQVEFNLLYEDDTTSKINVGPIAPNAASLTSLKSNLINFLNNEFNSETAKLTVSKYGNDWAGFESVKLVMTDKNILF